jgi:uncharacterized membrane protein YfcA
MKKKVLFGTVLTAGLTSQTYASAGYANDALEFALGLVALLLLVAGILKGIDFLQKNGKRIIHKIIVYIKRLIVALNNLFNKVNSEYLDVSHS